MKPPSYLVAILVVGFCFALRIPLEADPVSHILVQLPLLAWSGVLITPNGTGRRSEWNRGGVATLLVAFFTIIFWMLPRSIDAVLSSPTMELAKFITLPFGVGAPLAIGWARAHPLLRGIIKAEVVSMLGVLAFLYIHAPVRICNAYLVSDQHRLGYGFLFLALGLSVFWIAPLFIVHTKRAVMPTKTPATA